MERRVFEALATSGYGDITIAQARLVQRIGPDGTRLTALAEQAQVTKQTAGFLVDQLARAGYVERVPDPADGRARLIRLTERGRRTAELANNTAEQVQAEWAHHLGPRATDQLRRALTTLRGITDPYV
ncbi:MarR family transcriptional regulator [Nocardia aurea]|uniref:MarR family transcriptional regulator n=1 Tax=Nocardia aurea TaxID=2144174 RepID=A0ABV3FYM9_9NOCA